MNMRHSWVWSIVFSWLAFIAPVHADTVYIYAAASTADALDEIIESYDPGANTEIVAVYGGTSLLARQISAGANAHLILFANEAWADELDDHGLLAPASRVNLLTNRLVLVAPRMLPLGAEIETATDIPGALGGRRLGLSDPDAVPSGIYAREALQSGGVWDAVRDNIVAGDNVRTVLTWITRSEVGAGIVYQSDALSNISLARAYTFPEENHTPIRYPMALITGADADPHALAFYSYLRSSPESNVLFEAYGFGLSEDAF